MLLALLLVGTVAVASPEYPSSTPRPMPIPADPWPEDDKTAPPSPACFLGDEGSDPILRKMERNNDGFDTPKTRSSQPASAQRNHVPPGGNN